MSAQAGDEALLFRNLFETAPDAGIVVDGSGLIVLANPQAERLFGYGTGALVGCVVESLMPRGLRAAHAAHRAQYAESPHLRPMGIGFELVGMRLDGSEFPAEVSLTPVRDGEAVLVAASIRDISATLRVRQSLARAARDSHLGQIGRIALESRDDHLLLRQICGIVATALPADAVVATAGVTPRDESPVRVNLGSPPGLADGLYAVLSAGHPLRHRIEEQGALTLADSGQDAPGAGLRAMLDDAAYADAVIVALSGRFDTIGALIAISRKPRVFDRDQLQFLKSVASLASAALQRRRSEEELAHAQRLDAIGQLTGGVAHDFNNLLTVISGNIQLLEAETDPSQREHVVRSALRAVQNGAVLIRKLLACARRQRLTPRAIPTPDWLRELSVLLRRTLGEPVDISVDGEPGVPDLFADRTELDAALVNLALNARDAMPGRGELAIVATSAIIARDDVIAPLRAGTYVRLRVSDTGTGMSPEVLARATDPFFTTKTAGKGNGLGLSMVYGFARQSGGTMSIESRPGCGTRVDLYLPAAAPAGAIAGESGSVPPLRAREVVLVVEDDPPMREIAVAFLQALGYGTREAPTVEFALELVRSPAPIDLLFSDVVPGSGMSGAELAEAARHHRPLLPVLLTSGLEGDTIGGAASFPLLRKPYTREQLATAIHAAMDHGLRVGDVERR